MPDFHVAPDASTDLHDDRLRYYARKLQRHPALASWKQPLRAARTFLPSLWRLATHESRQLPSVVMVGAQKAGTTQLYAHLVKHPRLFPAWKKEVSYFSKHTERPVRWYRSQFPLSRRVAAVGGQTLDASPSYLPTPAALRKMHLVLPDARVIAVLRDPVARAFSHYQHYKTRRLESRSFEQAVEDELRQMAFPPQFGVALRPDAAALLGYVARGYYALQLELLFALYPPQRVLIVDSADLFADTGRVCQDVFTFLSLEHFAVQPTKVYNRGYYQEKVDPLVADRLREHYRAYDEMLTQLIGRPFGWMAKPLAA